MGQTIKRKYDRYTLAFKRQAIKLASHPNVTAVDIADSLGIHPVMLYRWRMEQKNGTLCENRYMKKKTEARKKKQASDPVTVKNAELLKANKRIKELEKSLASTQEELDILKKAKRFFAKRNK